eukprot:TRINITY_DN1780_c0_g1_i3.p2 TRINITY_DN1780_c0_g1~~TRINITY_DN1780_c0_g1_i3.p2  ORF type:complete len:183 (+),score=90.71 TRINITY_DN1780_c0_g1_i3:106-654(+)
MRQAGGVTRVDVMTLPDGRSRGCAIVEFSTPEEAARAMAELNESTLKGRPIFIREDREESGFAPAPRPARRAPPASSPVSVVAAAPAPAAAAPGGPHRAGFQLFVGNLPWSASWQDLKDLFAQYGDVLRADVILDQNRRSKGWGIVRFSNKEDAERAIEALNGKVYHGRPLSVRWDSFNQRR